MGPSPYHARMAPLRTHRGDLVSMDQAARVHESALRILAEIGVEVLSEDVRGRLAAAGFRVQGSRLYFEPTIVEEYVAEMRRQVSQDHRAEAEGSAQPLTLSVTVYSHHLLDLGAHEAVVFDEDSLARMTRLVDALPSDGIRGSVPGYLLDEPGPLQPVTRYRIAAENARHGPHPSDLPSPITAGYVLDMAEVMGRPIRNLPVYMPTPLRLGGGSLDIVLANTHRIGRVRVSSMPAAGASVPVSPMAAFAVSTAELLGGMVAVRALTGLPVTFYVQVFPFDMRSTAMVFGTPEDLLYQLAAKDLNRFYGGPSSRDGGDLITMDKLPGAQAAADKAAWMTVGALTGACTFGCAGTLSGVETFSPEQLLLDREIRDWVQRLVDGLDVSGPGDELLAEVRAGLDGGFLAQDRTLDNYRHLSWYPRLFDRTTLEAWRRTGSPSARDRIRAEIEERLAGHSYELDATRRRELERIWSAARDRVRAL